MFIFFVVNENCTNLHLKLQFLTEKFETPVQEPVLHNVCHLTGQKVQKLSRESAFYTFFVTLNY